MSRGFTKHEKIEIRKRLIDEFEKELKYQKINKISIDDLVNKVGIAKGSFYLFFKSKEYLFFEVINKTQNDIVNSFMRIAEKKNMSDKEKLKKFFFFLIKELKNHSWLYQLSAVDFDKTIRKLPVDMKDSLRKNDVTDVKKILRILNLKSNYSLEKTTVIMQIILSSVIHSEEYGPNYNSSVKIMIEILIDNMFENTGG